MQSSPLEDCSYQFYHTWRLVWFMWSRNPGALDTARERQVVLLSFLQKQHLRMTKLACNVAWKNSPLFMERKERQHTRLSHSLCFPPLLKASDQKPGSVFQEGSFLCLDFCQTLSSRSNCFQLFFIDDNLILCWNGTFHCWSCLHPCETSKCHHRFYIIPPT